MPKPGKTAARDYGARHQRVRAAHVAEYVARRDRGEEPPCALCGEPMTEHPSLLDLAHNDRRDGYRGLAHRACNRGWDAARKRVRTDPEPRPITQW